jgi:SAM-dependent methyltransferase
MMDFQTLFGFAMKRYLPQIETKEGPVLDLGASGKYVVPGATALGLPQWVWPRDQIPARDTSVAMIHAYHFLEHLEGGDAILLLREVERVLQPGGLFCYCVPYYSSQLNANDLDHKSNWSEGTFANLFHNDTYADKGEWRLSVHFQIIAGIAERNLALIGQLVKDAPAAEQYPLWYYPGEELE